jgi:hypothetical protein
LTVARYFPSSVRAIVHDGPDLPEDQEAVDDLRGTEVAMDRVFSKCAADAACALRVPAAPDPLPRVTSPAQAAAAVHRNGAVRRRQGDELHPRLAIWRQLREPRGSGTESAGLHGCAARGDGGLMVQIDQRMTKQNHSNGTSRSPWRMRTQRTTGTITGCVRRGWRASSFPLHNEAWTLAARRRESFVSRHDAKPQVIADSIDSRQTARDYDWGGRLVELLSRPARSRHPRD